MTKSIPNTTIASENSPRAVFYGEQENITVPLGAYLSEHSVELYTGNSLDDATFGEYFFCVADIDMVKTYLEKSNQKLPKTLIFVPLKEIIDKHLDWLQKQPDLKIVVIDFASQLTEAQAEKIINFFLGSDDKSLVLSTTSQSKQTSDMAQSQDLETSMNQTEAKTSEVASKTENETKIPKITAKLSQKIKNDTDDYDNETGQRVKRLYQIDAKETGRSKTGKAPHKFRPRRLPLLMAAVVVLVVLVGFPFLLFALETTAATVFLQLGQKQAAQGDWQGVANQLERSHWLYSKAGKSLSVLEPLFVVVRQKPLFRELHQATGIGERSAKALLLLQTAAVDGEHLARGVVGKEKGVPFAQLLSSLKTNLMMAETELALVEAEIKTPAIDRLFRRPGVSLLLPAFTRYGQRLKDLRASTQTLRQVSTMTPEIIGMYGPRTYLLVFQNNMEIRPTGGFIGSYGLATFDNGILKNLVVEDVYTADGALQGHVDPPEPIRMHLGQENWYMRDSNWDPDFAQSARRIAWFLDKEIDISVDGVIALDLNFVKSLLESIGPITVRDFQETVTAETLFEKAHHYSETKFFPGSTQKKDFLSALGSELISSIVAQSGAVNLGLVNRLYTNLEERHLLLYFVDSQMQALVDSYDWSGEVEILEDCGERCILDFVMLVDANLGVNKVNQFVKRSIHDRVEVVDDRITHKLTVDFDNNFAGHLGDTKLGGRYKNYLRVFVPQEHEVTGVFVEGRKLPLVASGVATATQAAVQKNAQLASIAVLVEVPPQDSRLVEILYQRAVTKLVPGQRVRYVYKVQKQPGTEAQEVVINLRLPTSATVYHKQIAGGDVAGASTLVHSNEISYNTFLATDQIIETEFAY